MCICCLNEKGSQQILRSAQTDIYFIFLRFAFFSLLLWKRCHLSEEIINALFLSSSNRKSHFLSCFSCNRIWINLKPHYAKIICHFTPYKRFMLLKKDWGWSPALQVSIQTMGKICKYPVGGGINKIWCYTPFSGSRLDTATIVIMFGHPTERQRMGRDIRAWCCLFPRSRHLISSSNYQQGPTAGVSPLPKGGNGSNSISHILGQTGGDSL